MASLMNGINLASGITSSSGNAFGLNTWQLKNGKYNGVTFCNPDPAGYGIPALNNGAIGGLVSSYDSVTASVNSFTGKAKGDPNSGQILIDTTMAVLDMRSEFMLQNAIKQFPYANKSVVENLGYGGWVHSFVLQIWGQDYLTAVNNIKNAIINPPDDASKNVLIHPTLGKIPGKTSVINFSFNESYNLWRGATVMISFLSQDESGAIVTPKSTTQKVFNAATACLGAITSITSAYATFKTTFTQVSNLLSPRTKNTQLKSISNKIDKSNKQLFESTNYVVKTTNTSAQISELTNAPIDYSALPTVLSGVELPALNSQTKTYNQNQGLILVESYKNSILEIIAEVIALSGGQANELVTALYESASKLFGLAIVATAEPVRYGYTVPYAMSLSSVLFLNNMPLSLTQQVFTNNPQLVSANYIEAGEVVYL